MIEGLLLAALAGAAIPVGGWLASFATVAPGWRTREFRHTLIAFGAGALVSAVALVLVPEGADRVPDLAAPALFIGGGVAFALLDGLIKAQGGQASQFLALLLDFLPEALALGALLGGQPDVALLLAGMIALQNLPESFNAFREIADATGIAAGRILAVFVAIAPLGPLMALLGLHVFTPESPVIGVVMLFASGGILYLLFEDVAPLVPLDRAWAPPLGAVAGFAFGLAGHVAIA